MVTTGNFNCLLLLLHNYLSYIIYIYSKQHYLIFKLGKATGGQTLLYMLIESSGGNTSQEAIIILMTIGAGFAESLYFLMVGFQKHLGETYH